MRYNSLLQTRHGLMVINHNDKYIGRSVLEYGEFSQGEVDLYEALLDKNDVVIDAGANFGTLTLPLARMCRWVFAFEPQPYVFQCLAANMALNSIHNATLFQSALSDTPGVIGIPLLDPRKKHSFGSLDIRQDFEVKVPCTVMTLDAMKLPACSMLKVDVEGMEEMVIRGATMMIKECRPYIYFENDRQENSESLLGLLRESGYNLFHHLPPLFNQDNYYGCPLDIFEPSIVSINVLAWPAERPVHISLAQFGLMPVVETESVNPPLETVDVAPPQLQTDSV